MSDNQPLFQAVGIIRGDIKLASERGQATTVSIQGKDYPLLYIPTKQGFKALEALTKQVEATGINQRLIVYPKLTHFPGRDKQYSVAFQLVGFDRGLQSSGVTADLADFEFKLCGLWQFIPVCPTPCISVFKNFTDDRLEFVKQSEVYKRVKFMKGSHIPVIWKDALVKPFRFNPKIEKEQQGKPVFVAIKAKFLPNKNVFGFDSLLSLPVEEAPKFFKASKKMKAEALLESKSSKKTKTPEKVESDFKSVSLQQPTTNGDSLHPKMSCGIEDLVNKAVPICLGKDSPKPKKRSPLSVPQVSSVESAKESKPMPKPKTKK